MFKDGWILEFLSVLYTSSKAKYALQAILTTCCKDNADIYQWLY
jgi:hypothetical protein